MILKLNRIYMNKLSLTNFLMVIFALMVVPSCNKVPEDKLSINFEKYVMPNGLQVILHTDHSDPMM